MVSQRWRWSDFPEGFAKAARGRYRAIVRDGLEAVFSPDWFGNFIRNSETSSYLGRAPLRAVALPDGGKALVRGYLHGGMLRFATGNLFLTWPPRPFRELAITVELQRRGIPTVEVCAAAIEKLPGPFYRGWFATRELTGAQDLWAVLQGSLAREEGIEPILGAVAASLQCLHRQGVCHSDLNLKNLLIRREADALKAYIIDFDKAALFLGPVPEKVAARNLQRLLRSVRKLDVRRQYLSESDWNKFVSCYHGAAG
jgi:serine/threonine protein kinase